MADTLFVAGTIVASTWLNDVNTNTYTILSAVAGTNTITGNAASTVTVGYPRGVAFRFIPQNTNTGAVTINISGLGVKNVTKQGTVPLVAGDLVVGAWAYITYDGTQFQLINPQGPLDATDTYITTAGTTIAYTLPVAGNFSRFVGNAVKLIFNAANTSTTPTLDVDGTGAAAMKVMSVSGTKIDPIVGAFGANIPATAIWDGTNWLIIAEYPSGRLLNTQTFTANGTYTPTPGTATIIVEAIGSGGAGGGGAVTAAGQVSVGGGGGSGGYTKGKFPVPAPTAVTIGAAGLGVVGGSGLAGNTTSLGALITALGGGGGGPGSVAPTSFGGGGFSAPASGAGGNIVANAGGAGQIASARFADTFAISGTGGVGPFGGYGPGILAAVSTGGTSAPSGAFGGGGGGGLSWAVGANTVGGNGAPGLLIVHEYS